MDYTGMNFTGMYELDEYVKSFLPPMDLIKLECVSKLNRSTPCQWKKLGFEDKNEFIQIINEIFRFTDITQRKIVKCLLVGRINGQQAKDILKQDYYGKLWCLGDKGIKAIVSGIFSPSEISAMDNNKRKYCLSKNGFKLIKQGILTPNEIESLLTRADWDQRVYKILSDKCVKMLLDGSIKKEEVFRMTIEELDKFTLI